MKRIFLFLLLISITLIIQPASAAIPRSQQSWQSWVQDLRVEALSQGIRPALFDQLFRGMTPSSRHMNLYKGQPEKRLTFLKYRSSRGDAYRIKLGRKAYRKNKQLLEEIGNAYGISPCFIVSIWGLETSYGTFMGSFPVVRSLATLAYGTKRYAFFRKELLLALQILNEGEISIKDYKGEWAGASGQPQFMPSSWHNFAVDYNGDGHKDIWHTRSDIFASIANYLVKNGWQRDEPWAIEVSVPYSFDRSLLTLKVEKSVREWQQLGVHLKTSRNVDPNLMASVIEPYGGPYFMAFNNFKTIMKWNRSTYYAGTVGYMADEICQK